MKTTGIFFTLVLAAGALASVVSAQTITFTTAGTLTVISGPDKLGLNGSSFTVTNTLTQGQSPIAGTTNQYATTVSVSSPIFSQSNIAAVVTLNYVGPNNSGNNIVLTATVKDIITLNLVSTVFVPSITSSPAPIVSTPLTGSDTLSISDSSSETVYGFSSGTISSVPAATGGTCTFSVAPTSLAFPIGGGTSSLTITASANTCVWTATANQSFIELGATGGTGTGTLSVTVPPNTTGSSLSGGITVAGATIPVTQAGPVVCTFTVFPNTLDFPNTGGDTTVNIVASSQTCAWTATTPDSWLSLTASSGTGSGSLVVIAAPNTASGPLNGTVTIAGQTIPVSESGEITCTYTVTPSGSFPDSGGTVPLTVTASNPACTWTATSSQTWATLSTASGTGNGTVTVTATSNAGVTNPRTASVTVAGQQVPLIQSGTSTVCSFYVQPLSITFPGTVTTDIIGVAATGPSCPWNVSASPSWITLSVDTGIGVGGSGNGSVTAIAAPNTGTTVRTGVITVAGYTINLSQLTAAGCTFTTSPSTLNFPDTGGTETISVTAINSTCVWTAASNQSWTTVSPTSGTGNGSVTVTAAANNSPSILNGSVTVAGNTITVTEFGQTNCAFTVSPTSVSFPGAGGSSTLTITANAPTCPWTATSTSPGVTFSPTSGTGSGTVVLISGSNSTSAPEALTATVAGQTISISEAAGSSCTYTVSPTALQFSDAGGTSNLTVTPNGSSCAWTAVSNSPAITIGSTGGTGTGSVSVTVGNDTNGAQLAGSVTVAGQVIPVTEAGGCTFTVSPSSIALDNTGGTQILNVTAPSATCMWTAATTVSTLTLNPPSGTGSGTIQVVVPPNSGTADITGTLTVGGVNIPFTEAFTTQIFTDVPPSAIYFDAVNILAAKGITTGCTATTFCPNDDLTRAQMAVFIVRSIYNDQSFSYSPTPYFQDVPPTAFGFEYIQKLYELGITTGCSSTDFCPDENTARDQTAVFLIRGRYGATTVFTYPGNPYFTDVPPTYFAFSYIQRFAEDGITTGCAPSLYCPSDPVIRGDMAILVVRALFNDLLPPTDPVITQVSPSTISPGQTETINITGANTSFVQGSTTLNPVPGLTFGAITVNSPTSLAVSVTASTTVVAEPYSVLVITGTEQAVLPNSLTVQ